MNCPKCGKELKEGQLYCEVCGNEIRIVPDFEPEFELEIHETLSGVAEEITTSEIPITTTKQSAIKVWFQKIRRGKYFIEYSVLTVIILLILLVFIGTSIYRYNSCAYQTERAVKCADTKDYKQAIKYIKRAIAIDREDEKADLLLADYYYKDGQKENAIITLREFIETYVDSEDAYRSLIKIYELDKEYEKINELLLDCEDRDVIMQFQSFAAFAPEFSLKEEKYEEIVPLKLSANTAGKIYYTMDGKEPTKASKEYTEPIFLEPGTYVVKAIFVNNYGIVSECAEHKYNIEVTTPMQPEVNLYSGIYNAPQMIEVANAEEGKTFYTTDGSVPTKDSLEYHGGIQMPLGESRFQFINCGDDGATSEITERIYELKLTRVNLKVQDAVNRTTLFLFENNYLTDVEGHKSDAEGRYIYTCDTAIAVNGVTYYLVVESYVDTLGTQMKTGNQIVVNAMTGDIGRAEKDANGKYAVKSF